MKTILLSAMMGISLLTTSCFSKKNATETASKATKASECPEDIICTMDYRMINVQVVDANGRPYLLDTYRTLVDGKETVLTKYALQPVDVNNFNGNYVVAEDGNMSTLGKSGREVTFVGLRGGREVVRHKMIIGHDCCHIQLLSGDSKVVVK